MVAIPGGNPIMFRASPGNLSIAHRHAASNETAPPLFSRRDDDRQRRHETRCPHVAAHQEPDATQVSAPTSEWTAGRGTELRRIRRDPGDRAGGEGDTAPER